MAQDYSRDVFALPGRFNDTISEGCNDLIKKQRAQLITSSEDFIQAMQWEQEHKKAIQTTMVDMLYDLNDKQRKIIDKLTESEEGLHVNQLVMELQIPYNEMVAELMMLELNGIAKGLPGGLWRRVEQ
jgi:DNA processing protein